MQHFLRFRALPSSVLIGEIRGQFRAELLELRVCLHFLRYHKRRTLSFAQEETRFLQRSFLTRFDARNPFSARLEAEPLAFRQSVLLKVNLMYAEMSLEFAENLLCGGNGGQ